jgi:hypothetical protein
MGARSTSKCFLNWMKRLHRPFLLVGLVAITLFVMVPQTGLVDDNDESGPDVLTVATVRNHASDFSSTSRKNQRLDIHNTVVLALVAPQPSHLGTDKSDFVFHDGRAILQSFCSLRC